MLKISNSLINILFFTLLTISISINSDNNRITDFLSESFLENDFLTKTTKNSEFESEVESETKNKIDNNLYNLIVNYKKKLFQENIMKDFYFNSAVDTNKHLKTSGKAINKKFDKIFLQLSQGKNFESFFNTTSFTWEKISATGDIPKSTKGFSMVLSDTSMVIFGGRDLDDEKYNNDVHLFDLEEKTWTKITPEGLAPTPRAYHSAVIRGTVMWIFGGSSDAGYLNELYSFDLETVKK